MPSPELPLQAVALEYHVAGALDGVTLAPNMVLPPARVGVGQPCQPIGPIEVANLGRIDLTGLSRGAYADRIVTTLLILGPVVPTAEDNVEICLEDGRVVHSEITIPPLANGIYSRLCTFVPQGHQLRLSGLSSIPGNRILVQIGFQLADTLQALAEMRKACCCLGSALNIFGEPQNLRALYTEDACSRTIATVAPPSVSRVVGTQVFALTGTGFVQGDVVAFRNTETGALLSILDVTVASANAMAVTVDVGTAPLGTYDVIVSAQLSGGLCAARADDAVEITP